MTVAVALGLLLSLHMYGPLISPPVSANTMRLQSVDGFGAVVLKRSLCGVHGLLTTRSPSYLHDIGLLATSVELQCKTASWPGSTSTFSGDFVILANESDITSSQHNTTCINNRYYLQLMLQLYRSIGDKLNRCVHKLSNLIARSVFAKIALELCTGERLKFN